MVNKTGLEAVVGNSSKSDNDNHYYTGATKKTSV